MAHTLDFLRNHTLPELMHAHVSGTKHDHALPVSMGTAIYSCLVDRRGEEGKR
jgi:hypothetical protein